MGKNSFDDFMSTRRQVAQAYVSGDAGPLREISTSSDPATFFGPRGGVEKGAQNVLAVNEAGATQFQPGGKTELEVFHHGASEDVAYWTGLQHATVTLGPDQREVQMTLRVTEVFRRENGEWRLVHRHADTMAEKADAPK